MEAEALKSGRHAIYLTGGLCEPAGPLHKYLFLRSLKKQNEEMRAFVLEADAAQARLEVVAKAFRELLEMDDFRDLLTAERLAVLPQPLSARIVGKDSDGAEPIQPEPKGQPILGGICLEVLDLLSDCVVPIKMFGLLRQAAPARQVEIAKLMIALRRVKLNTARVLMVLTPQSQLADPSRTRQQFPGIDAEQLTAMETELVDLSRRFQLAAERTGIWNLELVVARGYMLRLMESVKVVRYLAQHFPQHLATFQTVLDFSEHVDSSIRRRKSPGSKPRPRADHAA